MGTVANLVKEQRCVVKHTQYSGLDFFEDIGRDVGVVWDMALCSPAL